jgi:hypothetical protein
MRWLNAAHHRVDHANNGNKKWHGKNPAQGIAQRWPTRCQGDGERAEKWQRNNHQRRDLG